MISFELTEEQSQIRDMLFAFGKKELAPRARAADEACAASAGVLDEAWALGLTALAIPEAYGGGGAPRSALTGALMLEAMGYGCAGLAGAAVAASLYVNPLIDLGTEAQKRRELPKFCGASRRVATLALHEGSLAFDPSRIATRAERHRDGWRITGVKRLVPMGTEAADMLVLAQASDAPGIGGVRAFIVAPGAEGVAITRETGTIGLTPMGFSRIELAGVRLPPDAILGEGDGADIRPLLACLRIGGAALAVGLARAVTDFAIPYARERIAFGEPIAKKQSIAFMLADMHIACEAMRWMVWKAAAAYDGRGDVSRNGAGNVARNVAKAAVLAQTYVNRRAIRIADDGLQIFGGHGYIRDLPLEMWLRNARTLTIHQALAAA